LPYTKVGNVHAVAQSHFALAVSLRVALGVAPSDSPEAGPTGLVATILMQVKALAL